MNFVQAEVTKEQNFYGNTDPGQLLNEYGSPLYVYNERILRTRCREMKNLLDYPNYMVNFSAKANSNLELLRIIKDEGLSVDAMSPGEIHIELEAGFEPEEIFYIGNNVSAEELKYAVEQGVKVSVDSLSQLRLFGAINPGGEVAVRFNPGVGAGHDQKVVTGGKQTKFGVQPKFVEEVKEILTEYDLTLIGINQHIGSLFMEEAAYLEGVKSLLAIAENFSSLEFIDLGGGFGVPYQKQAGEQRLDLAKLGAKLDKLIKEWVADYGREVTFKVEPGRYIVAECGVLLGTVHAVKKNYDNKYVGTDLGFNVLIRPILYDSHHDIEIYRPTDKQSAKEEQVKIVGNLCETGDIIADNRLVPQIFEQDIIGVLNAGAYGYVMSSNYNNRLRPAEILINEQGEDDLIRSRETLADLLNTYD